MPRSIPQPNYAGYGFGGQPLPSGPSAGFRPGRNPQAFTGGQGFNPQTGTGFMGFGTNPKFPATPFQQGTAISQGTGAWNALFQQLQAGKGPSQGLVPELMSRFPAGSGRHMQKWFKEAAPMLATSLFGSPSYKFMQDPANWDQSQQMYASGAGQLGQAAQAGLTQGQGQLARMGLGRSGAQAALASQTQQTLGGQQTNLFTNLYQQSIQNRLRGAQSAFDLDRAIMQMVMGSTQMPPARNRRPGMGGPIASAGGAALGMGLGALFSGGGGSAAAPAGLSLLAGGGPLPI